MALNQLQSPGKYGTNTLYVCEGLKQFRKAQRHTRPMQTRVNNSLGRSGGRWADHNSLVCLWLQHNTFTQAPPIQLCPSANVLRQVTMQP